MKRSPKRTRLFNFPKSIDAVGKEDRLNALRKLAVENLEERQLLSASTLAESAAINDLASDSAIVARQDAFQPIDVSNAVGDETPSLVVTTESDVVDPTDGLISLREAVAYAKADSTLGDTITFAANVSTVSLTQGAMTVDFSVKIGDDATTVNVACNDDGTFMVIGSVDVAFSGVSISGSSDNSALYIANGANVTVKNATFNNNFGTNGGAIHVRENCNLKVYNSEFMNNFAQAGAAIYVRDGGVVETYNTLVAENFGDGGTIHGYNAKVYLYNVTVAKNWISSLKFEGDTSNNYLFKTICKFD